LETKVTGILGCPGQAQGQTPQLSFNALNLFFFYYFIDPLDHFLDRTTLHVRDSPRHDYGRFLASREYVMAAPNSLLLKSVPLQNLSEIFKANGIGTITDLC
jgi:hypothetical protein